MFVYFHIPKLPFSYFSISPLLHFSTQERNKPDTPCEPPTDTRLRVCPFYHWDVMVSDNSVPFYHWDATITQLLLPLILPRITQDKSKSHCSAPPLVGEVVCADKPLQPTLSFSLYLPSTKTELGADNALILYFATYSSWIECPFCLRRNIKNNPIIIHSVS